MERLAREKIAAQQRLAALRKEVPSIPGYSNDAGSLDLTSVVPVVLHSQQVQMIQQSERDSPLTPAAVPALVTETRKAIPERQLHLNGGTRVIVMSKRRRNPILNDTLLFDLLLQNNYRAPARYWSTEDSCPLLPFPVL